jgi:Kef-type K+ transport system membrane component KefB
MLSTLLILLTGLLWARLATGRLARWAVPAIVIELAVGFLLGNTLLPHRAVAPLSGLTELGVLTLFFQVGLEVRGDLLRSRASTILRTVALGCLAPLLAWLPLRHGFQLSVPATLLCLAVLSATGTGVTLQVLSQRQALATPSGRLLVGVSVLDDLPAIALLSLATFSAGNSLGPAGGGALPALAALAAAGGSLLVARRLAASGRSGPQDPLSILLLLVGWAWIGEMSGLTSLLGALWAGVLVARMSTPPEQVRRLLSLVSEVFLPLYFISVGMRLQASSLLRPGAWQLAAVLVALGVLAKLVCALGISQRDRADGVDVWVVVLGLMPRGLPGLVFATTALAEGVIDATTFSALVLMVASTTVLGLLLLERRLRRLDQGTAGTG